ncbi:hypothetical protein JHK87_038085 [Glycine soja]|nr:hypothetical protein JHK87_038085 [Glycine soja]
MKNDHNNNAEHNKDTTVGILDSRFNQTLRNVQGLLKGRNIPGKILLSQRVESPDYTSLSSPTYIRSSSYSETGTSDQTSETVEEEVHSTSKPFGIPNENKLKISASNVESSSEELRKSSMGARATDSARVMKFTKVLSETMVKLEKLREFSWRGVPDYMRPTVWRLLLGYAPPNSDRREGVLKRKRLDMQDHYTFAQPGIQRLVFKLKELVRRIDDPVSNHMEEQGLEFLQFAFRWFNCLLIREIPFHLVTRLWDTYLAEGDALPDFLVYISASFLLTWSDNLQKLDFQELVMFLQHLPTKNWTDQELEMVLSRAFMWHSMFNNSPSHLAN